MLINDIQTTIIPNLNSMKSIVDNIDFGFDNIDVVHTWCYKTYIIKLSSDGEFIIKIGNNTKYFKTLDEAKVTIDRFINSYNDIKSALHECYDLLEKLNVNEICKINNVTIESEFLNEYITNVLKKHIKYFVDNIEDLIFKTNKYESNKT